MEILGSILLVGIVLGSITAAYIWGLPLVNKSGDANRIDYAKSIFEKLSDSFAKVAREGGQSSLNVQLDKGTFRLEQDQFNGYVLPNEYVLTYTMQTDLKFFSTQELPINDFSSPYATREGWVISTALPTTDACGSGSSGKSGTLDLGEDGSYPVYICSDNTLYYNTAKYANGQTITFGVAKYTVQSVRYDATLAEAGVSGGYRTVVGLIGVDKPGVIMAKGKQAGSAFESMLKLKPRKMFDPSNNEILEINLVGAKGSSTIGEGSSFTLSMRNAGETVRSEQVAIEGKTGLRKVRSVTIEVSIES